MTRTPRSNVKVRNHSREAGRTGRHLAPAEIETSWVTTPYLTTDIERHEELIQAHIMT
jgi:hypothetical protein